MPLCIRSLLLLLTIACTTALHAEKPAMITRVFKLPPMYSAKVDQATAPLQPPLPIPSPTPIPPHGCPFLLSKPPKKSSQLGHRLPKGASATFNPMTGVLTVTNSQPNLDFIAAYLDTVFLHSPSNIVCTLTVIEGPGELIRQANAAASRTANAAQELSTLFGYAKNPGSKRPHRRRCLPRNQGRHPRYHQSRARAHLCRQSHNGCEKHAPPSLMKCADRPGY